MFVSRGVGEWRTHCEQGLLTSLCQQGVGVFGTLDLLVVRFVTCCAGTKVGLKTHSNVEIPFTSTDGRWENDRWTGL